MTQQPTSSPPRLCRGLHGVLWRGDCGQRCCHRYGQVPWDTVTPGVRSPNAWHELRHKQSSKSTSESYLSNLLFSQTLPALPCSLAYRITLAK